MMSRMGQVTDEVFQVIYPNMKKDQHGRIMASMLVKDNNKKDKKTSKQLKSRSGGEVDDLEIREMRAIAMAAMLPHLKAASRDLQIPILAALTPIMNVDKARKVCDMPISKRRWKDCRRHLAQRGALQPVEKVVVKKCRTPKKKLQSYMNFLEINDLLQRHAVGLRRHTYASGEEVTFDNISTNVDIGKIMREYGKVVDDIAVQDGIEIPTDEDRCPKKCSKNGVRCLLEKGHQSRCKYTPKSMFCPSSIEKMHAAMTSGSLTMLAGLDDEDVEKGYNNFKRIKEIANRVCTRLGMSKADTDKILNDLEEIQVFTESSFVGHTKEHAQHICACIACGFTSPQATAQASQATKKKKAPGECVACPYRENGSHKGPCKDCEKTFEFFTTLLKLAQDIQKLPGATEIEKEDFYELEVEIQEWRQLLKELRSHKVRKKTEAEYDRRQMQSLKRNECIVVSDFKMKILAMFHRENQKLFFGKRGIACLGFMVMTPCDDGSGDEIDVNFHLLFSNDTTQDANFVLSAKAALYGEILPTLFPDDIETIDVHFRSDGAGCFNCNAAKAAMHKWYDWTSENEDSKAVNEVSYRVSVNGGGKTRLDGAFGQVNSNLKTSVNNGMDITSAETALDAYENSSGIWGTNAAIFTPVRDFIIETNMTGLTDYHHLRRNSGQNSLQGFMFSGFGDGDEISIDRIDQAWADPPPMPNYLISWQSDTNKSTEQLTHSTEARVSRDKRRDAEKAASKEKAREDAWEKEVLEKLEKGIHQCMAKNDDGKGRCRCSYLSREKLEAHERSGKHKFVSQSLTDQAVSEVARSGGIMATGSHQNRLAEYNKVEVEDGQGLGESEGTEWYQAGWAQKTMPKSKTRFTVQLKKDLLEFFLDGEKAEGGNKKGKAKYTKEEALAKLTDMRMEGGLRKYSSTSKHGPLPTKGQITSIFGQYKQVKGKEGIAGLESKLEGMIKQLSEEKDCSERNKGIGSSVTKKSSSVGKKACTTKKEQKKQKDPNEPKRPLNAYLMYAQSMREQVKKESPDSTLSAIVSYHQDIISFAVRTY